MNKQKKKSGNIKKVQTTSPPSIPPVQNSGYNNKKFIAGFLFVFSFLLYANTISHDYALDDVAVIQQNKFTKQGIQGISSMLTTFYWKGYWDTNAGLYRPLSLISFALEYEFFPDNPLIPHLVNVVLYASAIALLYLILSRLFISRVRVETTAGTIRHLHSSAVFWLPFLVTLLFAAHPVHTEVVANIKSRDELLCFLSFLGAFFLLLRYSGQKKLIFLIISLFLFFLSLLSKEGALVFLGVIPLFLYFFTPLNTKTILRLVIPFGMVAIIWYALHSWVISSDPSPKITYSYLDNTLVSAKSFAEQKATAAGMMGKYILLLFYPHPLSYDYSFSEIDIISFSHPKAFISFLLCIGLLGFAFLRFMERNLYSFAILLFFVTMSMVSNIFMLIGATFADRLLFVPALGFCLIISMIFVRIFKISDIPATINPGSRSLKLLPFAVVLALYSFKTVTRNRDWKNNFTLFSKDVLASTGSGRTHYNYGTEVMNRLAFKEKDEVKKKTYLEEAVKHLAASLQIDPMAANSCLNLATAYYNLKDYKKAKENAALSVKYDSRDIKAYSVLGRASYRVNDYPAAVKNLLKVTQSNNAEGNQDEIYNYLGASYFGLGKADSAIFFMNRAKELNPSNKEVYINLGSVYGTAGQFDKSIENFRKALEFDSANKQVNYFLALTYRNMGDTLTAAKYFRKAQP
ncbi:MAG: DUF1736 domain-containing protein [Bacteroidetes bacterium]|nr:DUF1736 domain-containing protein [Bacteroidota bacterium]